MGPMRQQSFGGAKYLLTFIDEHSRKVFTYFIKCKSETFYMFKVFKAYVEKQSGKQIKCLRSDNGGEYVSDEFRKFCEKEGIKHECTVAYTPEQNGVAERMNRTLTEKAKCLLFDADLSKQYWAEAVNMAAYIVNRIPCTRLQKCKEKTPEEAFTKKKSDLSDLKLFGSKVLVLKPKQKRSKWDENTTKMIFVGYDDCVKGFRCFNTETRKMQISRNVKFFDVKVSTIKVNYESDDENVPESEAAIISNNEIEPSTIAQTNEQSAIARETAEEKENDDVAESTLTNDNVDDTMSDNTDNDPTFSTRANIPTDTRSSSRNRIPFRPFQMGHFAFLVEPNCKYEPTSVSAVYKSADKENWLAAMREEMESHRSYQTWTLVDLPNGRKPISAKWVFKVKAAGTENERFKARWVAKGYAQIAGIDFDETFAPVVRHGSLRILFAVAIKRGFEIYQMDAITAFLQSDLDEDIYMCQPEGYSDGSDKVCLLKKAIYGLKQAGRQWNLKVNSVLKEFKLQRSSFDPCVYFNVSLTLLIAVYVDDLLIFYKHEEELNDLKKYLNRSLKIKDIGIARECIGIRITKTDGCIALDQQNYIEEVLKKFDMWNCRVSKSPGDPNIKLSMNMWTEENDITGKVPYQEVIGSLLYIAQITRPDISFAVNNVSRFNTKHCAEHWIAVQRIMRYLKLTSRYSLRFVNNDDDLLAYSDADYASDIDKRRSCSGFILKYAGAAITWHSKRQEVVALSSTEAEYIALSTAAKEVLWVEQFLNELTKTEKKPVPIYCDNKSAITLANTDAYRERTKHIDVRHHHVRQCIEEEKIEIFYISTDDMVADPLTKPLNGEKMRKFAPLMGLHP